MQHFIFCCILGGLVNLLPTVPRLELILLSAQCKMYQKCCNYLANGKYLHYCIVFTYSPMWMTGSCLAVFSFAQQTFI